MMFLFLFASQFTFASAMTIHKEIFTTNAVCSAKHCVNPIFPGLEDLYTLSKEKFSCQSLKDVAKALDFCKGVVNYNPSLPLPASSNKTVAELVREQEQRAMTTYFVHLNAMGLEGWDYTQPARSGDTCAESIWRMSCYTYFPKTPRNCAKNTPANYIRPCQSSCQNYIKQCGVECCDESVQCSFEHQKKISDNTTISTFGYVPHDGPSLFCTGSAARSSINFTMLFFCVISLLISTTGFTLSDHDHLHPEKEIYSLTQVESRKSKTKNDWASVPSHSVGNWRSKPDYLLKFQYVPPGASTQSALLNSCSLQNLAQTLQCSGRGVCKPFVRDNLENPISFCHCDRDFADPECRTKRRSQSVAYVLTLFLGMFGIDKFYLGFPVLGAAKLVSFGGFGFWWVADIVHTGSTPIYGAEFRVAANLPHWVFVLVTMSFFVILGFILAACTTASHRRMQKRSALLFQTDADARHDFSSGGPVKHAVKAPVPQVAFPSLRSQ